MRITSRRGSIALRTRVTETIRPATIFAPFHWGGDRSIKRSRRQPARSALEDASV
jgi:assimilatory nitrate reductase catalytic subunit